MVKKITGWLHLWLGLISGIIVFIVSLTGCIHVFHEEILKVFPRPKQAVEEFTIPANGRPLLMPSEIVRRVEKQQHGNNVKIQPFMMRYLREKGSILLSGETEKDRTWYTVDPYTGEVLVEKRETLSGTFLVKDGKVQSENLLKFDFFRFILDGHMYLWLPVKIGSFLVRYGTLVFLVLLVSGLILWWPKNKAAAKQRYWFRWKKSTKWRRKNYDLHNISGFYMFLILFIVGLTGAIMGLEWLGESMHWVFSGGEKEVKMESVLPKDPSKIPDFNSTLDFVLKQEEQKHPEANTYSMYWSYPSKNIETSVIRVVAYLKPKNKTSIYDRYSTKLIGLENHEEEGLAHEMEELYLPIHEGSIGGLPTKILAFIASLIAATLPVTGIYIWWGRRKKQKSGEYSSDQKDILVSVDVDSPQRNKPAFKPRTR